MKRGFILLALLAGAFSYPACTEKGSLTPVAKPVIDVAKADSVIQLNPNFNYDTFYGQWSQEDGCYNGFGTATVYVGYGNHSEIAIFCNCFGAIFNYASISAGGYINDSNTYTDTGSYNGWYYGYSFKIKTDTLICNFYQSDYSCSDLDYGTFIGYQKNYHKPTR